MGDFGVAWKQGLRQVGHIYLTSSSSIGYTPSISDEHPEFRPEFLACGVSAYVPPYTNTVSEKIALLLAPAERRRASYPGAMQVEEADESKDDSQK